MLKWFIWKQNENLGLQSLKMSELVPPFFCNALMSNVNFISLTAWRDERKPTWVNGWNGVSQTVFLKDCCSWLSCLSAAPSPADAVIWHHWKGEMLHIHTLSNCLHTSPPPYSETEDLSGAVSIFSTVCMMTGFVSVSYFTPASTLVTSLLTGFQPRTIHSFSPQLWHACLYARLTPQFINYYYF